MVIGEFGNGILFYRTSKGFMSQNSFKLRKLGQFIVSKFSQSGGRSEDKNEYKILTPNIASMNILYFFSSNKSKNSSMKKIL